jgi:hypothetical protein
LPNLRTHANATALALALTGAAAVAVAVANIHRASLMSDVVAGTARFSLSAATRADDAVGATAFTTELLAFVTAVLFASWLFRSVQAVRASRGEVFRYDQAWAIVGWIVPIWMIFRPKQMVDDTWRGARPEDVANGPVPWYFHAWWAAWLAALLGSQIGDVLPTDKADQLATHDRFFAATFLILAVAAGFAIATVRAVANRVAVLPPPAVLVANFVFNPPPGWPTPPPEWRPVPGWKPDPSWPPAPDGWTFWLPRPF